MMFRYLLAAALIGTSACAVFAQTPTAGIEAWQRGDYASAVALWRPRAERGEADAQFNLGQAYRLGRGLPPNLGLAEHWFEKAALQGQVDAQTTLGLLLFQNNEQPAAIKWLKAAAESGEPRAMLVYGTALFNGGSVTQDPVKGYAYVYRANAQGLPAARDVLAQLDKLLSLADRKKGFALVQAQDKAAGNAVFKRARPPTIAAAKPAGPERAKVRKTVRSAGVEVAPAAHAPTPAAAPAPPAAPASGGWRIQLGAFNQRAIAQTAFAKVAGNPALAGRTPHYIPFGQFIRLRVGPFSSRASAASACSAVHVPCFAVAPGR